MLNDDTRSNSLSKLRDVMQRDPQKASESMKEQPQRGYEAMILLDVHGQELDDEQDDAYHAYTTIWLVIGTESGFYRQFHHGRE